MVFHEFELQMSIKQKLGVVRIKNLNLVTESAFGYFGCRLTKTPAYEWTTRASPNGSEVRSAKRRLPDITPWGQACIFSSM